MIGVMDSPNPGTPIHTLVGGVLFYTWPHERQCTTQEPDLAAGIYAFAIDVDASSCGE